MSQAYELITEMVKKGKLTQKDKRWLTDKLKEERKHEIKVMALRALASDPELKYFAGVGIGAATAVAGTIIGDIIEELKDSNLIADTQNPSTEIDLSDYLWMVMGPSGLPTGAVKITQASFGGGLEGNIAGILALGGTGFSGFCAAVLILKAIFSGTDLGELMSGAGEIIPL